MAFAQQVTSGMSAEPSDMNHAHEIQRPVVATEFQGEVARTHSVREQLGAHDVNETQRQLASSDQQQGLLLCQEAIDVRKRREDMFGNEFLEVLAGMREAHIAPQHREARFSRIFSKRDPRYQTEMRWTGASSNTMPEVSLAKLRRFRGDLQETQADNERLMHYLPEAAPELRVSQGQGPSGIPHSC